MSRPPAGIRPSTARAAALVLGLLVALAGCGPELTDPAAAAAEASALLGRAELDAAETLIGEAVGRWPQDAALRELQGDLELRRGRGARAQASYEKALKLEPANQELLVKLARSLLAQGRHREVLAMAEPEPEAPLPVRAGLALARLEAQLAVGSGDFRAQRAAAESLWRLAGGPDAGAGPGDISARLGELAREHATVEAGRQHAQCRLHTAEAEPSPALAGQRVASGRVLRVGPRQKLAKPSEAAAVARDGDVVEIDAGTYAGDVAVWTADDLVLRGRGGLVHLQAPRRLAENKAIWVIKGDRTTVQGIGFSGAVNQYQNGAGIRLEGSHLAVRDSVFHDNQMGILTGNDTPQSEILISRSEFRRNRTAPGTDPPGHNIYVGLAGSFTLEFSYVHGTDYGHNVKSRARVTRIRYNRIADGAEGRASYLIDLPVAGVVEIIGNELQKGAFAENRPFISYGAEAKRGVPAENALVVAHNTFYNGAFQAIAVALHHAAPATVAHNLFAGAPVVEVAGTAARHGNVTLALGGMSDPAAGDFRLTADSPAIDHSEPLPDLPGIAFEYEHPRRGRARPRVWHPDAGAHEYCREGA